MSTIRSIFNAVLYPFRMLARIPSNVISSPRRMLGLSLPLRIAILLMIGLLLIVIGWAFLIVMLQDRQQFLVFFRDVGWVLLVLSFAIPVVVWYALKLWLEGEPSPFPKIDAAWNAALKDMEKHSIDPCETPIYLLLGPPDDEAARRIMSATRIQFPVAPDGPGDVQVWANQNAIYVVCTQSCRLGMLLGLDSRVAGASPGFTTNPARPAYDPTRTLKVGTEGSALAAPMLRPLPGVASQFGSTVELPGAAEPSSASVQAAMQATMQIGVGTVPVFSSNQAEAGHSPRLDTADANEATAKLAYLCRCIRRVRDPLAPINGVLVTTPFRLLVDGTQVAVNQLQIALKSDVMTLREATRVRCGITHIVEGMQEEDGFRELIRRVGVDRAATQRFGKGFGLWNLPTVDQVDALVKHACGAFEDWSYVLFREDDGLGKRGNRHLYSLLCRIRLKLLPRLEDLVRSGYALQPSATTLTDREPLLFSGCYFVADGSSPDRQAFLTSIFTQKLADEQGELEWGSEAINEEKRMQTGVQVLLVINGILVAAIFVLFWI